MEINFLGGYFVFGLIGAATLWIILKWSNRQIRTMDLVRGAASWILGPLVGMFISNWGINTVFMDAPFWLFGFLIGFVVAIATRACLKKADLWLNWGYVLASGAIWGFGFGILLNAEMLGLSYENAFIIFIITGIAGSTALVFGLEKHRIADLTR